MRVTTQTYGQFLVNGVDNFTGTYFADIVEGLKHDIAKLSQISYGSSSLEK